MTAQGTFVAALLDPAMPVPTGLKAWNGSDATTRFAVYRNNVVVSLTGVLADTFPVVRELVGAAFFAAMARQYLCEQPPTSPVMSQFGESFPDWVAGFEPAAAVPYLADVARLEAMRLWALHAADAPPVDAAALAARLSDPHALAQTVLTLHPSLAVQRFLHPAVSLWQAHQFDEAARDAALARLDLGAGESALVLRDGEEVLVIAVAEPEVALLEDLHRGGSLGYAAQAHPEANLPQALALLLRRGAVISLRAAPAAQSKLESRLS